MSFAVGLVVLIALTAAFDGFGKIGEARHVPLVYLTGGLLGAAYVASVIVTVRTVGATGVVAATIAGQLTMALVVDQIGLLGVTRHPITAARAAWCFWGLGTCRASEECRRNLNNVTNDRPRKSIVTFAMSSMNNVPVDFRGASVVTLFRSSPPLHRRPALRCRS